MPEKHITNVQSLVAWTDSKHASSLTCKQPLCNGAHYKWHANSHLTGVVFSCTIDLWQQKRCGVREWAVFSHRSELHLGWSSVERPGNTCFHKNARSPYDFQIALESASLTLLSKSCAFINQWWPLAAFKFCTFFLEGGLFKKKSCLISVWHSDQMCSVNVLLIIG